MFLKAPQVRLEQVKRSLGIPRIDAAALKRIMRPFCCCTMRRPSATSSSARRRSSSKSIYPNNAQRAKTDAGPNLRKNWATEDHVHARIAANIAKLPGLPPLHRKYGVWRAEYWALRRR